MGSLLPLPHLQSADHSAVSDVLAYAKTHLTGVKRADGASYFEHGMEVAATLEELSQDVSLTRVAIMHDIEVRPDGLRLLDHSPLSDDEKELVRRMRSLSHLHVDENEQNLERLLKAFAEDSRLLLLRMAHRLNDIRHLERFDRQRRRTLARETLHMYASISGRLGFHRWRWQMEDICFLELHPKIARRMQTQFEAFRDIDAACLRHTRSLLEHALKEHGVDATVDERIKGLYSTYRKMVLKKRSFDELTDRLAIRILVPTVEDCYRTLGIVHAHMHPMLDRIKDYIGTPKENGYRSIHSVVYPLPGVTELPIEIQIRTFDMHHDCEFGIASHGKYKDWAYALSTSPARASLFRNLEHLLSVTRSRRTFTEALRRSFSHDRLLVFDPQNRLYHLQRPATAMDFACQIDPKTCRLAHGVKINGREQPLGTKLRDGDTVEIITGKRPAAVETLLRSCQQESTKRLLRATWRKHKATARTSRSTDRR